MSTIVTAPFTVPVAVGVAVALIVQEAPAANVDGLIGQLCDIPKGDAVVIEVIVAADPPLFLTAIAVAGEVTPTSTDPKFTDCGVSVIVAGVVPVPVSGKKFGDVGAFDAIVRFADCNPEATGPKLTVIVQFAVGASDAGQLLLCE